MWKKIWIKIEYTIWMKNMNMNKKDMNEKRNIFLVGIGSKNMNFFIAASLRPAKSLWNLGNNEGHVTELVFMLSWWCYSLINLGQILNHYEISSPITFL